MEEEGITIVAEKVLKFARSIYNVDKEHVFFFYGLGSKSRRKLV